MLELTREGALDQLTVKVESNPAAAVATCAEAGPRLQHNIKAYIGVSAAVVVCEPGTIERSVGKARRVIDRRAETRA